MRKTTDPTDNQIEISKGWEKEKRPPKNWKRVIIHDTKKRKKTTKEKRKKTS